MVVNFVRQSWLLSIQIFIQLQLQKARFLFDFLFVVNRTRVDFPSFCKTEMELNENLGIILKFRRFPLVAYEIGYS